MTEKVQQQRPATDSNDSSTAGTTLPVSPSKALVNSGSVIRGWSCGQPVDFPIEFGRYRIERKIGRGGMGIVYLGTDISLERPVAIKIPTVALDSVPNLRERFFREAKLAATMRHANLCPVYDFGQLNGIDYLVMAYIEGRPLSQFVRPKQRVPARNVATVIRCLANAMHEAHIMGIIHRDLKPSNIMIANNKQPVIMDFGLAKRTDAQEGTVMTQSGAIMGTPEYMPPEQIDGDISRIGPRTDVYALGVILYELLAGERPFQGQLSDLIVQIVNQPPPSLRKLRPDLDPTLEAICLKALSKKPKDRFQDMREFSVALTEWMAGRKPDSVPLPVADQDSVVVELFDEMAKEVVKPPPAETSKADSMYWGESKPKDPLKKRHRSSLDARRRKKRDLVWLRVVFWTAAPILVVLTLVIAGNLGWSFLNSSLQDRRINNALTALKNNPGDTGPANDVLKSLKYTTPQVTQLGDSLLLARHPELAEKVWQKSPDELRRMVHVATFDGIERTANAWWNLGIDPTSRDEFRMHCLWNAAEVYGSKSSGLALERRKRVRLISPGPSQQLMRVPDFRKNDRNLMADFAIRINEALAPQDRPWTMYLVLDDGAQVEFRITGLQMCTLNIEGQERKFISNVSADRNDFLLIVQSGKNPNDVTISIASHGELMDLPIRYSRRFSRLQFSQQESDNNVYISYWDRLTCEPLMERLNKIGPTAASNNSP